MEQILTEDSRGLNDLRTIIFKATNIIFYEMLITGEYAQDIEDMLKGDYEEGFKPEIYSFDSKRKIYQDGNIYIVEYGDKELRNNDKNLFKKNFGNDDKSGIHNPQFCGYFDYNDKFYLILDSKEKLTDEINKDKGVYKGVLVKPELFVKSEDIEEEVEKNKGKVREKLN